ncbi:MAG: hypothetical protein HY929_03655 [Euryarchaeota archaeon]|nr:hypothetical protein [Euryarchaeota archaeon]
MPKQENGVKALEFNKKVAAVIGSVLIAVGVAAMILGPEPTTKIAGLGAVVAGGALLRYSGVLGIAAKEIKNTTKSINQTLTNLRRILG